MSAFGGKADIKMQFATFSANADTAPAFDQACCARISSDSQRWSHQSQSTIQRRWSIWGPGGWF